MNSYYSPRQYVFKRRTFGFGLAKGLSFVSYNIVVCSGLLDYIIIVQLF